MRAWIKGQHKPDKPHKTHFLLKVVIILGPLLSLGVEVNAEECPSIIWYQDLDRDGFGNPNITQDSCLPPVDYVENNDDCNDDPLQRGAIFHPGAKEPKNFDDFNCDGLVEKGPLVPTPPHIAAQRDDFIVSSFQQGHGFTVEKSALFNLNDTSDVFPNLGLKQSLFLQTQGEQTAILKAEGIGPFDFTKAMPKLWLKIKNVQYLKELSLQLGNAQGQNFVKFNLKSQQGQKWITDGDWVSFSISWNTAEFSKIQLRPGVTLKQLRKNITDLQVRLSATHPGEVPVQLHMARISAVAENRTRYPNGVITFTFDDNWASQYSVARPKLQQYNFPASAYVIVGFLDTPNYMTTTELQKLQQDHGWEIAFHAFDPTMHLLSYPRFPPKMVARDILSGKQWLWEKGLGRRQGLNAGELGIHHFAYPKGEFKREGQTDITTIARKYFTSARTINERHREVVPPSDAHKLRVLYVTGPESAESVLSKIEKGVAAGEWIILVFHDLVDNQQMNDQWEITKFHFLVDAIASQFPQVPVRTIGDVLKTKEGP